MELRHYQALLVALKGLWQGGDPETKSKIIQWLIHKIEVGRDCVHIYYQLGESGPLGDLAASGKKSFFKSECSNTLTNGALGETRTPMTLRSVDFESTASTNSATRAILNFYTLPLRLPGLFSPVG